jgi:tetratricopeptide repeat protein 21B
LKQKRSITKFHHSSLEYFARFNPDFLVEIAKEELQHCGTEALDICKLCFDIEFHTDSSFMMIAEAIPPVLTKAQKLLELIVKAVPGQLECFFLLARTKYMMNDDEPAQRTAENCLRLNPAFAEAHMLMAQIFLKQDKAKLALQSLEQALAHNFDVRESVLYHLIKARIHEQLGEYEDSLKVLEEAMEIPGVRVARK